MRNSHCEPCVGCAKNCFDFNPKAAYLADLNDSDQRWSSQRRLFVGLFPGYLWILQRAVGLQRGGPVSSLLGILVPFRNVFH